MSRPPALRSTAAGLLVVVAVLVGSGDVAPAPPLQPDAWSGWASQHAATSITLGLVRLVAIAGVGYLLVLTAAVAALGRSIPVAARVGRLPMARTVLTVLGAGAPLLLAVPAVGATDGDGAESGGGARLSCVEGCPGAPSSTSSTGTASAGEAPATATAPPGVAEAPAPPSPPAPVRPGVPPPADEPSGVTTSDAAGVAADEVAPAAPRTWTIEAGEHLWHIARETQRDAGAPDDDVAVLRYLERLVDENRDVLVDPSNPDLVLPGQVVVLPAVDG